MRKTNYSGKEGWGNLSKSPSSEGGDASEIQGTFFRLSLPFKADLAPNFEPPTNKQKTNTSHRRNSRRVARGQTFLNFDSDTPLNEVHPAEQGFQSLRAPLTVKRPQVVTLDDGNSAIIPASINELKNGGKHPFLNEKMLIPVPAQLEALTMIENSQKNLAFQGDTGSGKTYIELMAAEPYLASGKRALLLTPTETLVKQHAETAARIFDLPEESVCKLSGEVRKNIRPASYADPRHILFISTPETLLNDLRSGALKPNMFDLVIYDEAHRAVGKYAYVELDAILNPAARRLIFSATLEKNLQNIVGLCNRLHIEKVHPINTMKKVVFEAPFYIKFNKEADPSMYLATKHLFNSLVRCSRKLENTMARAFEFKLGVNTQIALLEKFRKMTNLPACKKIVEEKKETEHSNVPFKFPTFREFNDLRETLNDLAKKSPRRFGRACSEVYELQHMIYLYCTLTCEGKYSFLKAAGNNLWKIKFATPARTFSDYTDSKAPRNFHRRIYASNSFLKAYYEIARGTLFAELQYKSSHQFASLLQKAFPEGVPQEKVKTDKKTKNKKQENTEATQVLTPKEINKLNRDFIKKQFFKLARAEMIKLDYVDSPLEYRSRMIIQRHCTFGSDQRVFLYNHSAEGTKFYMDRFNLLFADTAIRCVPVVGKKHMRTKERSANIEKFKNGDALVMGANSAANEGLHISDVNVMIRLSHSTRPIELKQTKGRTGRGDAPSYIYNLVAVGTHNEYRYYAGLRNLKRMELDLSKVTGMTFSYDENHSAE